MTTLRFDRLLALLPELEARTCSAEVLSEVVHEDGVIPGDFDWPAWMGAGRRCLEPGGVEGADLETCRKLLTVMVRQDRFVEDSLRASIGEGLAARIVGRVAELKRNGEAMIESEEH